MAYYTQEIKAPTTKAEGLENFVQMIINQIEAGNADAALLLAVNLHQDLTCGAYKEVTTPDLTEASVPMAEHLRAVEAARAQASDAGMKAGANAVRAEMKRLLGA